ncbi:MAG: aldehyde dehydrogenase family protein, partial [Pseudomonadota bacterium]
MSVLDDNIAKANGYLSRFRESGLSNQIAGQAVLAEGGQTFQTTSPIDNTVLAEVARSGGDDIAAAAAAAKAAFPAWRDLGGTKRKQILHNIADAITDRAEEIAFCECVDTGQAVRFMAKAALRGAENFR